VDNSLYCLDYTKSNFNLLNSVKRKLDGCFFRRDIEIDVKRILDQNDIVLLHYWNHPLLAKFLLQSQFPIKKLTVWCHNSGLSEPHVIPSYLASISSKLIFTNECSYTAHNLQHLIHSSPTRFSVVHSTRNLNSFLRIGGARIYEKLIRNLVYIGTVSRSKMHPDSAQIFAKLSKQGFSVRVVGGPDEEDLASAVRSHGGQIEVFGEVEDVSPYFRNADLFVYPLRTDHYGTGEQVILEAMASGLPVIAFDNLAERAILGKGGGMLVSSPLDFVSCVNSLRSSPVEVYENFSKTAMNRIKSEFSIERMARNLCEIVRSVSGAKNYVGDASFRLDAQKNELELYALHSFFDGEEMVESSKGSLFELANTLFRKIQPFLKTPDVAAKWISSSKSTPFQYLTYFPDNVYLRSLCQMITRECRIEP
jgi:glycosyltransferase involved in cell wall biosynthesis